MEKKIATEQETYQLRLYCTNCNYGNENSNISIKIDVGWFDVPKGVSFAHWRIHHGCPNCGCKTLEKV